MRLCGFYELPEATVLVSELSMGGCLLDALEEVESMDESSVRKIGAQVNHGTAFNISLLSTREISVQRPRPASALACSLMHSL